MQGDFLSNHHMVPVLYPVADAFAGGVSGDLIAIKNYRRFAFFVMTGAIEDAGISNVVTIEACSSAAAADATAMAFRWRRMRSSTTVDTWTALVAATSTGYNFASNNAVANCVWYAEVKADEAVAALSTATHLNLKIAETANKTITAAAFCICCDPRYKDTVPEQAIV